MSDVDRARWQAEGDVQSRVDDEINDLMYGMRPFDLFKFEVEDPTLTGYDAEEGFDPGTVVVVDDRGRRFFIEVTSYVRLLPALENDPGYIAVQRRLKEEAGELHPHNPDQLDLLDEGSTQA